MNQTADLTEKTLSREEKYQGSFLSLHVDQVQLPNGRTSFREVVEHVDGVAILALDDRNNVMYTTLPEGTGRLGQVICMEHVSPKTGWTVRTEIPWSRFAS